MVFPPEPPQANRLRRQMVEQQLKPRDIHSPSVLAAMQKVPRHLFGTFASLEEAYMDSSYPIQCKQTISQPYMVAYMTQELDIQAEDKILEIGTGSGYQTAILCELSPQVFSMERHAVLSQQAGQRLAGMGYSQVQLVVGDGSKGLPEEAPFDRILVTAAAPQWPQVLIEQLSPQGGIIVFPVDRPYQEQELIKIIRHGRDQYEEIHLGDVRFVPLVTEDS